jgi:CheY-like chemotaxis protein
MISMPSHYTQQPLPTVLVVDDNMLIRLMVTNILNDHGMRALPAACAQEALAIMDELDADPHLLISDISMPGMQEHEVMVQVNSNMLHDVMQTGKIEYFFRFAPAPSPTFGWSSTMPDETAAMLKGHFPNTQIVRVTPPSN